VHITRAVLSQTLKPRGENWALQIQPRTRISCHASLDEAARAPFSKERRMTFAKATKFHRKSGEGAGQSEFSRRL
jgi:hypothetical protein